MSPGARSGLFEVLLRVVAISVFTVAWTQGQVISFGHCPVYQTSEDFTYPFIQDLIAETDGYTILMTTDKPETEGCYQFIFKNDQTFELAYVDSNYLEVVTEGWFNYHPKTITDAGFIDLGLPHKVLGGGPFGGSRLHIICSVFDYFVAISCESFGFFKKEHVHVFAKLSNICNFAANIPNVISDLLNEGIPHANMFRVVDQSCTAPSPDLIAQYRSALESSTGTTHSHHNFTSNFYPTIGNPASPLPTHQFSSHDGVPAQVATYPGNVNPALLMQTHQFNSSYGTAVPVGTYPRYESPVSRLPTRQFASNYGAEVPVWSYPRYVNPASPLPTRQFASNDGAEVPVWSYPRYVNPASPLPTQQFPSHNGVPGQIRTYYGIRRPERIRQGCAQT